MADVRMFNNFDELLAHVFGAPESQSTEEQPTDPSEILLTGDDLDTIVIALEEASDSIARNMPHQILAHGLDPQKGLDALYQLTHVRRKVQSIINGGKEVTVVPF